MVTPTRNPLWSDLPKELLSIITNSLTSNPIDILAFRSVCNSWRSSFPRLTHPSLLSPPLPLTLSRPPYPSSYCVKTPAFLTVTIIYAIRAPLFSFSSSYSSSSWFLFLDEYTPARFRFRRPFSYCSCLPFTFPKTLSLVEFSRVELGRFYNLKYDYNGYKTLTKSVEVSKVILLANRSAVIALYPQGTLWMLKLDYGFLESGHEWENIHDPKEVFFDDIVEFKGRVLGVDRMGTIYEIGYDSAVINAVFPPIAQGGGRRKRLVASLGMLYMVVGFDVDPTVNDSTRITKFKVYELNEEKREWFRITSIGDRSFFIGFDFSFSASTKELATCATNSVFFIEDGFRSYSINRRDFNVIGKFCSTDRDIGVYHLNDDTLGEIGSYPGYSDVLWPPPSWIWGIDRLKRLETHENAVDEVLNEFSDDDKTRFKRQSIEILEGKMFRPCWERNVMDVLKLKEVVNMFQEDENNKFMDLEKKLEEATMSMHDLKESKNMLDQIESQLEQARTSWAGDVSLLGWPNELETALEQFDTCDAVPSHLVKLILRQRDLLLFKLEGRYGLILSHRDILIKAR